MFTDRHNLHLLKINFNKYEEVELINKNILIKVKKKMKFSTRKHYKRTREQV